jgi:hypothetical protein
VISGERLLTTLIAQEPPAGYFCAGSNTTQIAEGVYADSVVDPDGDPVTVSFTYRLDTDGTGGSGPMALGDGIWAGGFRIPYAQTHAQGGVVSVTVVASDGKAPSARSSTMSATLDFCRLSSIPG